MSAIEIFKPTAAGKSLTSMEGVSVSIGAAELQEIATGYTPSLHEAPLVIGHPKHDAPAYGWVKSLSFADGSLTADCDESPELGDLVAKRHYKKVSASFYQPQAPGNPTPGKWALRHVGFLGALAPGVKGLRAVSFAEAEEGVVTFGELPGYAGSQIARIFGSMRDFFIGKFGQEEADRVISSWDLESLRSISQRADEVNDINDLPGGTPVISFADPGKAATSSQTDPQTEKPQMEKTAEQLQAELAASQKELATLKAADAKRESDARHSAHVSFAEGLVAAAKVPEGMKGVLVAALDHLTLPSGVVSFGEGEAAKPLADALKDQLTALPTSVSFGEFAKDGKSGTKLSDREVSDRAKAYMDRQEAAGNRISVSQAIDAVNAGTDKA